VTSAKRFPKAFIIRPFGEKEILLKPAAGAAGAAPQTLKINFDHVQEKLIKPAMDRVGLTGDTTQEFVQSGAIPRDMFQRLLTAELVIADISIHNANVFYELGIRHALRDKRTFLIRCKVEGNDMPFDINSARYLQYDRDDPAKDVDDLVRGLQATVDSSSYDSPMYTYLPDLASQDVSRFVVAPEAFIERINAAKSENRVGDIQFFADEVAFENWGLAALQLGARVQTGLNAFLPAARLWEQVRAIRVQDNEADLNLGKLYAEAGKYQQSKDALMRLRQRSLDAEWRARVNALLGDNASRRWIAEWKGKPNAAEAALRSPALRECWLSYLEAFESDLHNVNYGIDALVIGTVLADLARRNSAVWEDLWEDKIEADAKLKPITRSLDSLPASLELALSTADEREKNRRLEAGSTLRCQAERSLITSKKTGTVADKYRSAAAGADRTVVDRIRERLLNLRELGVLPEKTAAALDALDDAILQLPPVRPPDPSPNAVVVFMGMRDDDLSVPDEPALRQKFKDELAKIAVPNARVVALAGCAPAEVVFHEVCEELLVRSTVYVSYDTGKFRLDYEKLWYQSWLERYKSLIRRLELRKLQDGPELPGWLGPGYNVKTRTAQWVMHNALQYECRVVLLVPNDATDEDKAALEALMNRFQESVDVTRI
jgi:hypothetical protein